MGIAQTFGVVGTLLIFVNISGILGENRSFVIDYDRNCFVKDGKDCFQYISGSVHYFRIPQQYWRDRLMKLRAAGLDAVTTYIMWNYHERTQGTFIWDGNADVVNFIQIAQELGLLVIVRPGPYIDNDVDFGGLPWWLLKEKPPIKIRSSDERFLTATHSWLTAISAKLRPLLYSNGGPIISVQVENEYGFWFECDKVYMSKVRDMYWDLFGQNDTLFFTNDGVRDGLLKCGVTPGVYPTVDFGVGSRSDTKAAFKLQKKYASKGPFVVSEFYPGWEDRWGTSHITKPTKPIINTIEDIWSLGGSVSIFMFEGGTNFGYWAGSEGELTQFNPITTSYDYDAPLSEAGDPREKYYAIREMIERLKNRPCPHPVPPPSPVIKYLDVDLKLQGSFIDLLNDITARGFTRSIYPLTFEDLDWGYGYGLYIVKLTAGGFMLTLDGVHDRAYVLKNQVPFDTVFQRPDNDVTIFDLFKKDDILHILVENEGRFASATNADRDAYLTGLVGNVTLDGRVIEDWIMYPLSLERLTTGQKWKAHHGDNSVSSVTNASKRGATDPDGANLTTTDCCPSKIHISSVYTGEFEVELLADTYINTAGWGKGIIFINGFNLGRYWPGKGPQVTLYVPKHFLKQPKSKIIIFELEHPGNCDSDDKKNCKISFEKRPIWT